MAWLQIWPSAGVALHQSSLPPPDQTVVEKQRHFQSCSRSPFLTFPPVSHKRFPSFYFSVPHFYFPPLVVLPLAYLCLAHVVLMLFSASPFLIVSFLHACLAGTRAGMGCGFLWATMHALNRFMFSVLFLLSLSLSKQKTSIQTMHCKKKENEREKQEVHNCKNKRKHVICIFPEVLTP